MVGIRSTRQRQRRALLMLTGVSVTLLVVWLYGLVQFADSFPTVIERPDQKTDAIVVLTGGSGRLEAGLMLLQSERADLLFVSGVYQGIDVNNLISLVQEEPVNLTSRVEIGNATNTRGNATETAAWANKRKINSLRLVTAAYHMPRSLLEFSHAMDSTTVIAHPVFPEHVKADWWLWPGTAGLVIKEYHKYLMVWMRLFFEHLMDGTLPGFLKGPLGAVN